MVQEEASNTIPSCFAGQGREDQLVVGERGGGMAGFGVDRNDDAGIMTLGKMALRRGRLRFRLREAQTSQEPLER